VLSEILVNKMKPFSDAEIIKECLEAVAFSDSTRFVKLVYQDSSLEEQSSNSETILTEV
jgi:hypothetical protein